MKSIGKAFAATVLLVVAGCSGDSPPPTSGDTSKPAYFVLDDSLSRLQADFNAMIDKVRLVFISGPSCGICLRGMDDLNRSIVQSVQNDPRIHTFVLYVPTLEAGEKHAVAATPLMTGPRVSHYWDPGGNSGLEFQTALDISGYAWDVWMIYEPGARWQEGHSPPAPVYWEHQLPFLPKAQRLDAARFATQVRQRLAVLPAAGETAVIAESRRSDPQIMAVMQPRGVMIKQNHLSRGGYQNIKRITAIRYRGETEVGDRTYPLTVETQRPNSYKRTVINNGSLSILVWDGVETVREGKQK